MDECQKWIVIAFVIALINLLSILSTFGVLN
jgi:hypothetical protein